MLGVFLLMQAATPAAPSAQQPAPVAPAPVAPAPVAPAPVAPAPPVSTPAPPGYAPQPQYFPYPYPPPAYPPPYAAPAVSAEAPPTRPEREVTWFVRVEVGMGPPGFSEQTELLKLEGYGGAKFWATADGGYLIHPNIGVGAWVALSHWSSSPHETAPSLSETAYFVGGEVPIKFGPRWISLVLAPRLAFCTGQVEITGDAPFQSAFAFGAELSVISFKYHVGGSLGILRAATPPPGELGRDHDFGGFHVLIGGTFDG